jgi:Arc/MetJ-type ribon-helix-helix transcriptional regulator
MSQIAVRLTQRELGMLDSTVSAGGFASRAEAVRAGLRLLERDLREARIAASYRTAYATPLTEDERTTLDAALTLAADTEQ